MTVLLLRLCGPMQAWGTQSRFTMRDTGLEPSKSGVIGLICAALGLPRCEPVDKFAALRMGVRVDREGVMKRDYQTAGGGRFRGELYGVAKADGTKITESNADKFVVVGNRYYLADADFLVGLEARDDAGADLLRRINAALRDPHWQIFLGRKACPPSVPVYLPDEEGLVEDLSLLDALIAYPWPCLGAPMPSESKRPGRLRFVVETDYGVGPETRYDQPEGDAFSTRRFLPRSVETIFKNPGDEVPIRKEASYVPLPANP
jgi:CRISPR system Cascade subunit CasD